MVRPSVVWRSSNDSEPTSSRSSTSSRTTIICRWSSGIQEVSSDAEPRWMIIALSERPVVRRAAAKPSDIDISTVKTATTSAIPEMASRVTCQRLQTLRML
jgi:hypothetical protein